MLDHTRIRNMLSNPRLDRFILLVSLLAAGVAHSQESRYSWEAVSNIPSWFKTGIATALIDPMPGVSSETLLLPFVVQAVSEINPNERELRRRIIDVLVARVEKDQDNRVKSNAI